MTTRNLTEPMSPYLKRPTRSLEMVLAERFEIPCPTGEADERKKAAVADVAAPPKKTI